MDHRPAPAKQSRTNAPRSSLRHLLLFVPLALWVGCSEDGYLLDSPGDASIGGGVDEYYGGDIPAGQLTAGQWTDLDNWDFWLDLFTT